MTIAHSTLDNYVQLAEDAWRRGEFGRAFEAYTTAARTRLIMGASSGGVLLHDVTAADFIILERLSDLARLLGHTTESDELLALAISQIGSAGNQFWTDL